jgi:hypothetical protein
MQKVEAQRSQAPQQAAQRQGGGAALESPQCDQIAQLEAMVEVSPQVSGVARFAAMANGSPQAAAQRQQLDILTGETAQREEAEEPLQPKVAQREEAPAKLNNTGLPDNLKRENLWGQARLSDI